MTRSCDVRRFALLCVVLQPIAAGMRTQYVASRLRSLALVACAAVPVLAIAQSASAACAAPMACVCEAWPTGHVIHGKVRESTAGEMTEVEVAEVLAGEGIEALNPGDVIRGVLQTSRTCGVAIGSFAAGDEVLALWQGAMPEPERCPEYSECTSNRCQFGSTSESFDTAACRADCAETVRDACPSDAGEPRLMLVPWGSELDLGEGRKLDSGAAGILASRLQCSMRFPAPPPPPCNDVIRVPVSEGCSVAVPGPAKGNRGTPIAFAWVFAFALVSWARRRRRS